LNLNRLSITLLPFLCFLLIISGITAKAETFSKEKPTSLIEQKEPQVTISGFTHIRTELDNVIDKITSSGIYLFSRLLWTQLDLSENRNSILLENSQNVAPALDIEKLIETEPESSVSNTNTEYMTVKQYIEFFTMGRGRRTLETGFTRAGKYRRLVESIFKREGVPTELIWLAQVESVWQPVASSSAAARGIWQFIPATGERFGLRQDAWLDERLDVEKATVAAAKYLNFLNRRYNGDWLLAMAAYNYGEGAIDRAIKRSGSADFWTLRNGRFLPLETSNYVPAILAVSAIAKKPEVYGVNVATEPDLEYESISINRPATLDNIAAAINRPVTTIKSLNPELISRAIPPGGYEIRVPKGVDLKLLSQLSN
jgi:membrane-bound lytic murein transglycosylase D